MKRVFFAAIIMILGLGVFAPNAQARTVEKCDDSVPPVCEQVTIGSSRRSPLFFFKRLGIDVSAAEAQELWRNREIRNEVMRLWRTYLATANQ